MCHYNNDIGEVMWGCDCRQPQQLMVPPGKIVGGEIELLYLAVLGSDRVVVQVLLVMKTK